MIPPTQPPKPVDPDVLGRPEPVCHLKCTLFSSQVSAALLARCLQTLSGPHGQQTPRTLRIRAIVDPLRSFSPFRK